MVREQLLQVLHAYQCSIGLNSLQIGKSSHMCSPKCVLLSFAAQKVSNESVVQGDLKEAVNGML